MSYDQPVVEECVNHPGYAAAGHCPRCGMPVCAVCLAAHQQDPAQYCPAALPFLPEKPRSSATLVLGIVAGVLFLGVIVLAAVVYFNNQSPPPANSLSAPAEQPGLPPAPGFTPPPAPPLTPPAPAPVPAQPPSGTAREDAAKAVALQDKPGWVAVINSHQPDWSQVVVWIGPSRNDLRLSRSLTWDPNLRTYTIMDEGPVPQPPSTSLPPAATPAPAPAANAPQPGEQAALSAALANDPGYEATVVKHSADWKKVTVDTGLPLQPLSHEYRFHWDDNSHQYIVDHMGPLGRRR
jgi:hypothetical protein